MKHTTNRYLIEAVIDGQWQWFAGRVNDGSRLSGSTTWSTTDDKACIFQTRRDAENEQQRMGGKTFIRLRETL